MSRIIKLRLQGYVKGSRIPNTFFVDYVESEVFARIEYAVRSINGEMLGSDSIDQHLTIRRIRDQFGNVLPSIPPGWKSICTIQFLFKNVIIEKLKTLDSWDYNPDAIDLELVEVS